MRSENPSNFIGFLILKNGLKLNSVHFYSYSVHLLFILRKTITILRVTIAILRVTITITPVLLKTQKNTHFQGAFGHKKDRNPIFQGISVVLPKLYLGGGDGESRTRVRKSIPETFYECSLSIVISYGTADKQAFLSVAL